MIFREQEAEIEERHEMRGGKGTIRIKKHVPAELMQGKCRLCATLYIPPGASIGPHAHRDEYEIFVIRKGRGVVNDDGTYREVGPGDAVLTGGGASHAVENTGEEEMEITAVILT